MQSGFNDMLTALGRLLLAVIFIYAGASKIGSYAQTAGFMASHGISGALLPAVIALELGGGFALAFGLLTRLVAAALAVYSVAAIVIFLLPPANHMGVILALAELAFVGGLCDFAARGGGGLSVDRLLFGKAGASSLTGAAQS